jgi:hypothetical protein
LGKCMTSLDVSLRPHQRSRVAPDW